MRKITLCFNSAQTYIVLSKPNCIKKSSFKIPIRTKNNIFFLIKSFFCNQFYKYINLVILPPFTIARNERIENEKNHALF